MTIEDIRNIYTSLPYATEDIKYGTDLCFSVEITQQYQQGCFIIMRHRLRTIF